MSFLRARARVAAAGIGVVGLVALGVAVAPSAGAVTPTVDYYMTPGTFDFVVPAGVTTMTIEVNGAQGGDGGNYGYVGQGGLGGRMTADFTVTPGETLKLHVGQRGTLGGASGPNGGGQAPNNGGCSGVWGGSGGDASDVRRGGDSLADRIIVAGGGGGGGGDDFGSGGDGGAGGGATPTDGEGTSSFSIPGGAAGTSSAGGAGGSGGTDDGAAGSLGLGGAGAADGCASAGGGGGGYYGGGGGAQLAPGYRAGGGGGSAYVDPSAVLTVAADGVHSGDGAIVLTYTVPPATTTTTTTTTAPTTTTTVPAPEPPAPTPACPQPHPPTKVETNAFGLAVAKYLIDNCDATGRAVTVGGSAFWVLDPPAAGGCPSWAPRRVEPTHGSLMLGLYLVNSCRFTVQFQKTGKQSVPYVVPSGWPAGARVA